MLVGFAPVRRVLSTPKPMVVVSNVILSGTLRIALPASGSLSSGGRGQILYLPDYDNNCVGIHRLFG